MTYTRRPTWELEAMRKALSMLPWLNTEEENQRIIDVTKELKRRMDNDPTNHNAKECH